MNKRNAILAFLFLLAGLGMMAQNAKEKTPVAEKKELITVYYFHYTSRCPTCMAIETETKNALQTYYANDLKNGSVVFKSLNLDEEAGKQLSGRLKVVGQTLLIVKGKKQINLTNEAFLYARTDPEKFKQLLRTKMGEK
jgi:hypothetical protein